MYILWYVWSGVHWRSYTFPISFLYIHTHTHTHTHNAQYKSVESAVATRARLHGLKWPSTNSKFLAVDFLTPEDVTRITEGQLEVKEVVEVTEAEDIEAAIKMEMNEDGKYMCMFSVLYLNVSHACIIIAERLSARQLILHRISPSVCMCVCVSCHASVMQLTRLCARAGLSKRRRADRATWPTRVCQR